MRKYKSYTEEFKREAVARSKAVGVTRACEELDITSSTIYGRIKNIQTHLPLRNLKLNLATKSL